MYKSQPCKFKADIETLADTFRVKEFGHRIASQVPSSSCAICDTPIQQGSQARIISVWSHGSTGMTGIAHPDDLEGTGRFVLRFTHDRDVMIDQVCAEKLGLEWSRPA